jgi:hypothetical protein
MIALCDVIIGDDYIGRQHGVMTSDYYINENTG